MFAIPVNDRVDVPCIDPISVVSRVPIDVRLGAILLVHGADVVAIRFEIAPKPVAVDWFMIPRFVPSRSPIDVRLGAKRPAHGADCAAIVVPIPIILFPVSVCHAIGCVANCVAILPIEDAIAEFQSGAPVEID